MRSEDDRLPEEFLQQLRDVEQAYLSTDDLIRQSGFLAGATRVGLTGWDLVTII